MGNSRRARERRRVVIFFSTLIGVLCVGFIFIWIGMARKNNQKVMVYEFFKLPSDEIEKFAGTALEQEFDMNKDIYQASVDKGERVKMVPCVDESVATLLFAGDVLLDDSYAVMSNFRKRGSDFEDTFSNGLLHEIQMADIFMINNEFPFTDRGKPTPGKTYTFHAKTENVGFLKNIGVDIVTLANNHAYDYGEVSIKDTLMTLEKADIPYVGAGNDLESAKEPYYMVANGMKIAFVAATQIERYDNPDTKEATESSAGVLRCFNPEHLLESIRIAEENADFTILYVHWGTESTSEIDRLQKEQVGMYVDAGVDLIIGAHPHVLQKIDYVGDVPVVYSLGNFWFNSKDRDTGMVKVELEDKKIKTLQFIPCVQSDCRTRLADGMDKAYIIENMRKMSDSLYIDNNGYINKN